MMKIYFAIVFLIEKIKIALETNKFKLEFIHEHLVNFIWWITMINKLVFSLENYFLVF